MSRSSAPLSALDEVRQANRLFLSFLKARPHLATRCFGLSPAVTALLGRVSDAQLERAAGFPRALFRFELMHAPPDAVHDPMSLTQEPDLRVLMVTLLLTAWNLSRSSVYAARFLLRLSEDEIGQLQQTELTDLLPMSLGPQVVHSALDDLEVIFRQWLRASTPERQRHLLLLGLQPELGPWSSSGAV